MLLLKMVASYGTHILVNNAPGAGVHSPRSPAPVVSRTKRADRVRPGVGPVDVLRNVARKISKKNAAARPTAHAVTRKSGRAQAQSPIPTGHQVATAAARSALANWPAPRGFVPAKTRRALTGCKTVCASGGLVPYWLFRPRVLVLCVQHILHVTHAIMSYTMNSSTGRRECNSGDEACICAPESKGHN
jgi:hypothetical protein